MKRLLLIFLVIIISFGSNLGFASASAVDYKLVAADGAEYDNFGMSVAISGDTVVVGAPNDNDNGDNSGSAYVFVRGDEGWVQQAKLVPDDGMEGDGFGYSVAVDGDTAVIGATSDPENNGAPGSAYVFVRTSDNWSQQAKLIPGDRMIGDMFGCSVAVEGDTAVIGACGNTDSTGSAYVFIYEEGIWDLQEQLYAGEPFKGDKFGYSVAISENRVIVGVPHDDDNGTYSGSAYVFVQELNGSWSQQAKLISGDGAGNDEFGCSVAIYGDTALVGARYSDAVEFDSGSAYVFIYEGVSWVQQGKLIPDDGASSDLFGWSVAIHEDAAIIGAPFNDEVDINSGSTYYLFEREEGIWSQQGNLAPDDGAINDHFGLSVALTEDIAVVGAPLDDDNGDSSGSAYIMNLSVNLPPVAVAGGPYVTNEGAEITLDASSSYDPDDGIVLYEWDLDNDGEYDDAVGVTTTRIFEDNDIYTVGLKVTDSYEAYGIDSANVTVSDLGPSGNFSWMPEPQAEGAPVAFTDMSVSYPDLIDSWSWDFAGLGSSTEQSPAFTFLDNGTYTVTLTVIDDDGSTDNVTHDVIVENMPPEVEAGPDMTVELGDNVSVGALFTDPGVLDTHSAIIYWDDDTSVAGVLTEPGTDPGTVTGDHMYTWPGVYEVTVEVIDNDGGQGTDELTVEVDAVAEVMVDTLLDKLNDIEQPSSKHKGSHNSDFQNTLKSFRTSLNTVSKILDDRNPRNDKAAINSLKAFINKLEAQRGKLIPADTANELIAMAEEIIDVLNEQ